VVIYPKDLTGLAQVLTSRNVIVPDDLEDHSELYSAMLDESDQFECPPLFMREDCDQLASHPVYSLDAPKWMTTAARVATGNRRRVLEDGPDVMNSDDEDSKKDEHGEELKGMYAQGCSSLEQARISEQQAQMQRAMASVQNSSPNVLALLSPGTTRQPTPVNSEDEDWSWMHEGQRKLAEIAKAELAKNPVLSLPPPRPATRIPDPEVQTPAKDTVVKKTVKKAAASPRAPADQPTGAKAPPPTKGQAKGQESPETKVSTPMETRGQAKKKASGAGGLRGVAGSGQTDTRVAKGHPSKT
jgi:hypothetical protein